MGQLLAQGMCQNVSKLQFRMSDVAKLQFRLGEFL